MERTMDFTTLITVLIIFDLYMVITQSAESGDGQNYPRLPRPDEAQMRRRQMSAKDKRVMSSQDEETSKRGRLFGESSAARSEGTGKAKIEYVPEAGTNKSEKKSWSNEEDIALLRLAYAHYNSNSQAGTKAIAWKPVVEIWHGKWDLRIRNMLKSQTSNLHKKMRKALVEFDNGLKDWTKKDDDELLKIYFATEAGDESKHGERIYAEWVKDHPSSSRVTPAYLLERAETMVFSVMKFSLDNPQGKIKPRQLVAWQPKHDRLLRYLWGRPRDETKSLKKQLFDEAVKHCPAIQLLDIQRVYQRAKWLSSRPVKNYRETHIHEEYNPGAIQTQYHSFMDDQNFPSLSLRTHGHHVGLASTSSQPGPSHSQPGIDLNLNLFHSGRQSPDTNLYLGYQSHDEGSN